MIGNDVVSNQYNFNAIHVNAWLMQCMDCWVDSLMLEVKLSQILRADCQRHFRSLFVTDGQTQRSKTLPTNIVTTCSPGKSCRTLCKIQQQAWVSLNIRKPLPPAQDDEQIRVICIFVVGYLTALMFYFRAFYSFPVQHKDEELTYWTSKDNLVTSGSAQYIHYTYLNIVYSNTSK